jgi:hypothetical protein
MSAVLPALSAPRTVLALDPGKLTCGVALFINESFRAGAFLKADNTFLLGEAVEEWWQQQRTRFTLPALCDTLVCEGQQIYPGMRTANPNDLLPLSYLCGAVQARVKAYQCLMPLPKTWKGSLRKESFTRRILSSLRKDELQILKELKCPESKLHNVVDAVGLGLWHIGAVRTDDPPEVV